jgi:hypothetical protein
MDGTMAQQRDLMQDRGVVNIFLLLFVMAWCLADQKFWPVAELTSASADWKICAV